MGNPSKTAPSESNPHAAASIALLALTGDCITMPQQQALIDAAGVRAQLAIAYELNTIGRILARAAEIVEPETSIAERLGA